MALFEDDKDLDFEVPKANNPYLDNPRKGLALLQKILSCASLKDSNAFKAMRAVIDETIIPLVAKAQIDHETAMVRELVKLSDGVGKTGGIELVGAKRVVGIGGRFSAGKSRFINSLIGKGEQLLPEGQNPTTSVSTYIINGEKRTNTVCTLRGVGINVDAAAVIALNHKFYEQYSIGFSKYISSIVLTTPLFKYRNIALLDTPGYNKSDTNKKQEASDLEKSKRQLKNVDYIIWLVDSDSPIKSEDLNFLETLGNKSRILVVVNKADKRNEDDLAQIIDSTKEALDMNGISYFDVVGYSSLNAEEILSENVIEKFLSEVDNEGNSTSNLTDIDRLSDICDDISGQLGSQMVSVQGNLELYQKLITDSTDISGIEAVINAYRQDGQFERELFQQCTVIGELRNSTILEIKKKLNPKAK